MAFNTSSTFAHSVSSGFLWAEVEDVLNATQRWTNPPHGLVVQIPLEIDPAALLEAMQYRFADTGLHCVANVRLAHSNPAVSHFDDEAITKRVISAMQACEQLPDVQLQFDTFVDIDRGYGPRHGFIDRHMNLRAIGRWLMSQ